MEFTGVKTKQLPQLKRQLVLPGNGESEALVKLEARLAEYTGAEHCVLMPSGTYGLLTALKAASVREGDGVLCTSFSFLATSEIIALAGASPVYVDTNPNTFNVDPYCLEYVLKKCARRKLHMPKALVAANLFGMPCDFDALNEVCSRYNVTLIEDMSCSFGASYKGKKTGNFGRFSVASFFPAKPLGENGDGGGVFCRTRDDAKILTSLCESKNNRTFHFNFTGINVVGEKLTNYTENLSRRQLVAARYRDNLSDFVKLQQAGADYISAYTQFAIELNDQTQRDFVIEALKDKQIPCSVVCRANRARPAENEWENVVLTNAQKAETRLLTIPIHPYLSVRVVDYISECIMEAAEMSKLDANAPV